MAAGAPGESTSDGTAIRIEPLSPAVGLWVDGVDLLRLDPGTAAMIKDLWQLGATLLFRDQPMPGEAAGRLASVLAKAPMEVAAADDEPAVHITGDWSMPGAARTIPPTALVFAASGALPDRELPDRGLPALELAGMEAAADALRMEDPAFFSQMARARAAHVEGGPEHPVLYGHPLSGAECFYPPPPSATAAFAGMERLLDYVARPQFCFTHAWQPRDVLAVDPRAVRCRWVNGRAGDAPMIVVPGMAALAETRGGSAGREQEA